MGTCGRLVLVALISFPASTTMTEYTSPMLSIPSFPDDLTLPQFLFDYEHPIRLRRDTRIPWIVDADTGESRIQDEVRVHSFSECLPLSSVWAFS